MQKVIVSGSCGDYDGFVDVSLSYPGDIFWRTRSQGLLFKILHKLIDDDCGNWISHGYSLK